MRSPPRQEESSPRRPAASSCLAWLALLLLPIGTAIAAAQPPPAGPDPALGDPGVEPGPPSWPDSLEEWNPEDALADWDSVTAAYDASARSEQERQVLPRFSLRVNKAEGLHVDLGGIVVDRRLRLSSLELRAGYDLARGRPNGLGRLRLDLRGGRWLLEASAHDDAVPFGRHVPYGNTWFALFGGYDAMQFLREREMGLLLSHRWSEERQAWLGWVRTEQRPLPPASDFRFFGSDRWMKWNERAEPLVSNGVRFRLRRAPRYQGETIARGLVVESEATVHGGELLGGGREFSLLHSDLGYARSVGRGDGLHARASASLAVGRPPLQAWPDLGGDAGLRAFPPRGFGTSDTLVGYGRLLARLEFRSRAAQIKRSRLPVLRDLGLKLVPFVEAGAVWGREPGASRIRVRQLRAWKDLHLPRPADVLWDLGFGLRRDIDYSGVLSYVEVDFAWPMGADTGPVRITLQFSKDGLD